MMIHFVNVHDAAPVTRLQRKRELKIEAVLDAASAILERDGLDGMTLQRVAQSMGLVPAALYRYVGSKDGLLAALQRGWSRRRGRTSSSPRRSRARGSSSRSCSGIRARSCRTRSRFGRRRTCTRS
jgi:AcrR family transcriptional regulator